MPDPDPDLSSSVEPPELPVATPALRGPVEHLDFHIRAIYEKLNLKIRTAPARPGKVLPGGPRDGYSIGDSMRQMDVAVAAASREQRRLSAVSCDEADFPAIQLLFRVMTRLDEVEAEVQKRNHASTPAQRSTKGSDPNLGLKVACEKFYEAINADCFTAYTNHRRVCRACFLHSRDLLAEEATHGFLWKTDAPTRRLIGSEDRKDEDSRPVCIHLPREGDPDQGTFHQRECVGKAVSVRLEMGARSNVLTLVIFLNWRKETLTRDSNCEILRILRSEADRSVAREKLERMLIPAIRYFSGWLTTLPGLIVEDKLERAADLHAKNPQDIANDIYLAVRAGEEERLWSLRSSFKAFLPDKLDLRIHKCRDGNVLVTGLDHFELDRDLSDRICKQDPNTLCFSYTKKKQGDSYLDLEDQKLVDISVAAQAAAWKVSLLIDYHKSQQGSQPLKNGYSRVDFSRIRVRRKGDSSLREMAVLIPGTNGYDAIANVTGYESINEDSLRRCEILSQLYQKLSEAVEKLTTLHRQAPDRFPEGPALLERFFRLSFDEINSKFQYSAKLLGSFLLDTCRADLVHLMLYDARHDVFRALGITCSPALVRVWYENDQELKSLLCTNYQLMEFDPSMGTVRDLEELKTWIRTHIDRGGSPPGSSELLHNLVEQMIISRMRPRGQKTRARGLTWSIMNSGTCFYSHRPNDVELYDRVDEATKHYSKILYGRPFATDRYARANGVVWIGWNDPQAAPIVGEDGRLQDVVKEEVVQTVIEVIASVFALYQYIDPDSAINPLPFFRAERRKGSAR